MLMLRKHAALIIAISLIALVTTACIVRSSRPPPRRGAQPVYIQKKQPQKHKKHKHKKHR